MTKGDSGYYILIVEYGKGLHYGKRYVPTRFEENH